MYKNAKELIDICTTNGISIWEAVLQDEIDCTNASREEVFSKMGEVLEVMKNSVVDVGTRGTMGGIIGGESKLMEKYVSAGKTICGPNIDKAMTRALAGAEHNASMGKIVAAPTAGSSGILPAVIITGAEIFELDDEAMIKSLITASGVGKIVIQNATVSGAEGGCQAECGSAAAMAAAALVEMAGGSVEMSFTAAAIALKNIMGLICDPVAGLVEAPCSKRNASGAVNAMISAELALAGVASVVNFDETVKAMYSVGRLMHPSLRETALGGIAATETAQKISKAVHGE